MAEKYVRIEVNGQHGVLNRNIMSVAPLPPSTHPDKLLYLLQMDRVKWDELFTKSLENFARKAGD